MAAHEPGPDRVSATLALEILGALEDLYSYTNAIQSEAAMGARRREIWEPIKARVENIMEAVNA